MALTSNQKKAAAFFWVGILTREEKLTVNLADLGLGANQMKIFNFGFNECPSIDPDMITVFVGDIIKRLDNVDSCDVDCLQIILDYRPIGLLAEAAEAAGILDNFFPKGKLTMTFGSPEEDNLILTSDNSPNSQKKINASEYVEKYSRKVPENLNNGSSGESKSHSMKCKY